MKEINLIHFERDAMSCHVVVVVNPDRSKVFVTCMNRLVSLFTKQCNKWFMTDKDIIWNRGGTIDNLKK